MAADDMSAEDAARFDTHHSTLEDLNATSAGQVFLEGAKAILSSAAATVVEAGELVAPLAKEGFKDLLLSLATAAITDQWERLNKK